MECTLEGIPKYLHYYQKRKVYKPKEFKTYQLLYRTGFTERENPIEFPRSITALSVCWSKLINPKDVLNTVVSQGDPNKLGNHVYFGKIGQIRKIKVCQIFNENEAFKGQHILESFVIHTPLPCNYSHSEIMIMHRYKENGNFIEEIISKKQFEDRKCLLRKKQHKEFFQPLILEYQSKMATALNSDINELEVPFISKILPKNLILSLSLWKAIHIRNK
jgi:hypothetical protein